MVRRSDTGKSPVRSAKRLVRAGLRLLGAEGILASKQRREANAWLREHAGSIKGDVLSIGSGDDSDGQGSHYRRYFAQATSYTTSEYPDTGACDLRLDVRDMPEIPDSRYDGIFCSGVLEHVDDFAGAMGEITRILRPEGDLLLGLPFRQALHFEPQDFWRFTEYGIRYLLRDDYDILTLAPIDESVRGFPAAYWVHARKKESGG